MEEILESMNAESMNPLLNNELATTILFATIILLIGFAIGKLIGIALFKFLNTLDFDKNLKKISNSKFHASKTISTTTSWIIYTITVILALTTLNILGTTIQIMLYFIAILIIGTIILGIYFSIPNIIAGITLRKKIKKQQEINTPLAKGKIIRIGLLNTKIETKTKDLMIIPNKTLKKYLRKTKKT